MLDRAVCFFFLVGDSHCHDGPLFLHVSGALGVHDVPLWYPRRQPPANREAEVDREHPDNGNIPGSDNQGEYERHR